MAPGERVGASFDLFEWEGAVVTGEFDRIVFAPGTVWDTSELYTTGRVTLVPEPSTLALLLPLAMAAWGVRRRRPVV